MRPPSGLSIATVNGGAAPVPAFSGPQMVAVPLASLPLVCGGDGGGDGGSALFGLPATLLAMGPGDSRASDGTAGALSAMQQSQAQVAAAVAQGMATAGPMFAMPLSGSSSGYVMGEIMEFCDASGQGMGGPLAMAMPLPMPGQQAAEQLVPPCSSPARGEHVASASLPLAAHALQLQLPPASPRSGGARGGRPPYATAPSSP